MTPEEKANELIDKMIECNYVYEDAICSAIVCVDEIIISLIQYGKESNELQNMDRELYYWHEVKQEIEKL